MFHDIRHAHRKFGHPAPVGPVHMLDHELFNFRMSLIHEEVEELANADSLAEVCGEAADLLYVTVGLFVALGIPYQPFFDAIHAANMAKIPNGRGKWKKPEGWTPPDLCAVLYNLRRNS